MSARFDPSDVRCHHAARLIQYYAMQGRLQYFLSPLLPWTEHPTFHCWIGSHSTLDPTGYKDVVEELLRHWPVESIDTFFPFPVIQLLKRHSLYEQRQIYIYLRKYHGWFSE